LSRGTYPVPAPSLRAELHARIAANWWLKFFGITAFITVFFFGYFVLLRFPLFGVTVMPLTAVDRLVTFQPWALGLYVSLWLYVSLPPTLLQTRPEFYAYGWVAGALAVVGLAIFLFWPTSIPPTTGIEWSSHPGFSVLKRVDAAQNACPSLHVAFAVFSGLWLDRVLRKMPVTVFVRVLSAAWCLGIVYSTIATRQHVAVDVAAGAALGLLMGLIRPAVLR
jgi:membrane-associated phospholipid phosphatase